MFFAIAGLTLGFMSGLKPGVLGVFVIHQTMSRGRFQGFLSSLAPILTDVPIIYLSFFLALELGDLNWFISAVSLLGSMYLLYIAYKTFNEKVQISPSKFEFKNSSLLPAIKLNILNPAPYAFWLTVGNGYLLQGSNTESIIFVICLLVSLCATKFLVALVFKFLGEKFNQKIYSMILKSLTLPLILFSVWLFYSAIVIWL